MTGLTQHEPITGMLARKRYAMGLSRSSDDWLLMVDVPESCDPGKAIEVSGRLENSGT